MPPTRKQERVELHSHLGAAVHPSILWSIAHRQGIKLPSKSYWDFEDMVTMTGLEKNKNLDQMDKNFYHWTELIQSSPDAIEESVKATISGGYRKSNITLHELRFCPMKRNRGGERDLDHIIMSAVWGAEKSMLEYPQVKAGIILMMDRSLTFAQNEIIVQKAIKYQKFGVVGVDLAGPNRKSFSMKRHAALFELARRAGLGVTVHTGEENQLDEMRYVVSEIKPDRIGHGIECVSDPALMAQVVKHNITLEICPTSNLRNSAVKNAAETKTIFRALVKNKVKFAICTDGPEMYKTSIHAEQQFLLQNKILDLRELDKATDWAREASFVQ
ncbi:MAG: amidohydrolase family protein [Candidatus Doudnabacteria bacterium]|nr:amidohydrolase family protein [Candidatus Doudnabacteria bacterium]